jgi:hypothetical protein
MKNYMEQFRIGLVSGAEDYTAAKTLDGETDLKVLKSKLYDTSSSANAFASLTAGDYVKMEGWEDYKTENNGILRVVEVESAGEWVTFDRPLIDVPEADIPTGGITMYNTPKTWTVTGVAVADSKVMGAADLTNHEAFGPEDFRVTAANTVTSFAEISSDTDGDDVLVFWAKVSEG